MRGDNCVAGEGRIVGVPKFHSWGKCTMLLTNTQSYLMSNALSCLCIMFFPIPTINPLTANDDYTRHRNSATWYQLAQSVLKIGFTLAERVGQGEMGGSTALLTMHDGCCSCL